MATITMKGDYDQGLVGKRYFKGGKSLLGASSPGFWSRQFNTAKNAVADNAPDIIKQGIISKFSQTPSIPGPPTPDFNPPKSNTMLYVAGGVAVLGAIMLLKPSRGGRRR